MTFNAQPGQALTRVEIEALALAADGYTSEQTARRLGISREAVLTRTASARRKLGARSTTHAVVLAHRTGQLDFDCGAAGITRALEAAARLAAALDSNQQPSTPRSAA
ncbi:helix-turn-helix domain-containing protein [Kitasatospora sp. A2-31]|uniref:helix-turn-helix domain-containing protein n=1 Tax=Kitasatospora sp. A2-31 TaxID=2916414 RepID=UPI001EE8793C|nr:helix-turn-helix domain-containing protein [Kitasatospora sp. A2-31]MCG6493410.1 helix-turn-helix domain-containing protein [Kitasatospora sp. A2-31]